MEDYKEKYEMALEGVQEILSSGQDSIKMSQLALRLHGIFPELGESEDERIRKEILEFVDINTLSIDERHDRWIAWLEKQSSSSAKWQKNTPENKPPKNHSVLMKTTHGVAEGYFVGSLWFQFRWSSNIIDSDVLAWMELSDLDAQGVQKPTSDIKYKVSVDGSLSIVNDKPFDYEKATITQKDFAPINDTDEEIVNAVKDTSVLDMVEPKFKVGDWIVNNYDGTVGKIARIHDDNTGFEKDYHLWTIQDAKDGDVLYSLDSYQPFIYKERKPFEQATAHCGINKYGKFFVWNTKDCIITLDKYIPATKEQRDQLEKAMFDAGYKWNKEKLKLEKI